MDNLSSHKNKAVRHAIRAAGAKLFFLPPYSPDLNPIEQAFSKLKTLLRKANARSIEQVEKCIAKLLQQINQPSASTTSSRQDTRQPEAITLCFWTLARITGDMGNAGHSKVIDRISKALLSIGLSPSDVLMTTFYTYPEPTAGSARETRETTPWTRDGNRRTGASARSSRV